GLAAGRPEAGEALGQLAGQVGRAEVGAAPVFGQVGQGGSGVGAGLGVGAAQLVQQAGDGGGVQRGQAFDPGAAVVFAGGRQPAQAVPARPLGAVQPGGAAQRAEQ